MITFLPPWAFRSSTPSPGTRKDFPRAPFRRAFELVAVLTAVFAGFGCSKSEKAAQAPGGLTKIRFLTDWYPQAEHGGFYQALAKGYYREAGIEVEIVPGGPGPGIQQKMLGGAGEMAMARSDDLIVNVQQGLPVILVGTFMQRDPQAILLHEENPVNSFADLNGKTIMAVPGSNWERFVRARYKINFSIIPLNYGLAQFMSDKNFIQQCFITNEPYYVRQNGGRPKTLLLSDSGYSPYRGMMVLQRFLRENEAAVRAFVAASTRGWKDYMEGDPSAADALILAGNPQMTPEFLQYSRSAMKDHGLLTGDPTKGEGYGVLQRERLQEQMDALVSLQIIPAPVPLERVARFDLAP